MTMVGLAMVLVVGQSKVEVKSEFLDGGKVEIEAVEGRKLNT